MKSKSTLKGQYGAEGKVQAIRQEGVAKMVRLPPTLPR